MAHLLATQVDEHATITMQPPPPSPPHSSSSLPQVHVGGREKKGGHLPYSCWRTFMSYFRTDKSNPSNPSNLSSSSSVPLTSTPTTVSGVVPRPIHSTPFQKSLLGQRPPHHACTKKRKTLVLDLDETLVHSSFKPIPDPSFVLEIELEGVRHKVFVRKRPGVDYFLKYVAQHFEVIIFTASLAKYADPLLDILDPERVIAARLFRESCVQHYGQCDK